MKSQSRTIKTNPGLYRVDMGGSGGYRRLPGGSDDFSLQTNTQTDTHHNIYITILVLRIMSPAAGSEHEVCIGMPRNLKIGIFSDPKNTKKCPTNW